MFPIHNMSTLMTKAFQFLKTQSMPALLEYILKEVEFTNQRFLASMLARQLSCYGGQVGTHTEPRVLCTLSDIHNQLERTKRLSNSKLYLHKNMSEKPIETDALLMKKTEIITKPIHSESGRW